MDKNQLSQVVQDYVLSEGACATGIATSETLAGGPESTDLSYLLPGARSAVSFAVPLDQELIPPFLGKRERLAHERDNLRVNALASGLALHLAKYLEQKGHASVPVAANDVYRQDTPGGALDMLPDISHRYLAVRSGVGSFGLSGNVLHAEYGAAVILGAVVTSAELNPTDPLADKDNYCDACGLCMAACASGLMDRGEKTTVSMGGQEFSYSKRKNYLRCQYVCGGFTGLEPGGKWSTWSPGRFPVPEHDDEYLPAIIAGIKANAMRPSMPGGHYHSLMREKLFLTCGNCQLLCHPDKAERQRRHQLLTRSGVVVQEADGVLVAMTPGEGSQALAAMEPKRRALYQAA